MKKNSVKKGIFTALLLASPFVTAGTQYPAADFQPKVVYQDKDYQHEGGSSSSSASLGEKAAADANYPAATFQPKVVYQDTGYKHKTGGEAGKSIPLATWTEVADSATEEKYADDAEAASESPLFAVVVLAVAAFLFSRRSKGSAKAKAKNTSRSAARASNNASGLTGVARYLQEKSPQLTGVAKYLAETQATPKSGVAKYVAKKVVAAKQAASEKVTGVEKYVRNKG